jgi:DNA polymerase-3 subunit delta'
VRIPASGARYLEPVARRGTLLVGQAQAAAQLEAAASRPLHAYLLVGPPGTGKEEAAVSFAAALLCPAVRAGNPADGTCDTCRRVLAGIHPDVVTVEREGPWITVDTAREITRLAERSPLEGTRQVLILRDFHLVREAGPALLKTVEEPPPPTVFVILADYVLPELVTIASRCARIDFRQLTSAEIASVLRADGIPEDRAEELASAAEGRLDRARLLARDPNFELRQEAWRSVPACLDGTGAAAAVAAGHLLDLIEASLEPLKQRHSEEVAGFAEAARMDAGKSPPRTASRELEERHRRELRRHRSEELRAGLAILARSYRDRLSSPLAADRAAALHALDAIEKVTRNLQYNPGELLTLQALLVKLGRLPSA